MAKKFLGLSRGQLTATAVRHQRAIIITFYIVPVSPTWWHFHNILFIKKSHAKTVIIILIKQYNFFTITINIYLTFIVNQKKIVTLLKIPF